MSFRKYEKTRNRRILTSHRLGFSLTSHQQATKPSPPRRDESMTPTPPRRDESTTPTSPRRRPQLLLIAIIR